MTISQKIRSSAVCRGTWLSSGSATVAELAAHCGLDWLLFDMEHGCLTEAGLPDQLRAVGGRDLMTVVRVPTHEAGLIGRVLDAGADAIMVPHVESAEQARALVRAMTYPPLGDRGYSRSVRAYAYGIVAPESRERPMLFVQIESVEGVANVDAIAKISGVDVLFVGPADLKLSLSTTPNAPAYEVALNAVTLAAKANGLQAGILIRDRSETAALEAQGFTKLAVDSDLSILRKGFLSIGPTP